MGNYKKKSEQTATSSSVLAAATGRGATRAAHAMKAQLSMNTRFFHVVVILVVYSSSVNAFFYISVVPFPCSIGFQKVLPIAVVTFNI